MWKLLLGAALGYAAGRSTRAPGALRPTLKAALKVGFRALEKGTERMAHLRESLEDIAAEVKADLETQTAADLSEEKPAEPAPKRSQNYGSSRRKPRRENEIVAPGSHR